MTVIYVDTLFLLNAMVDYLLLLASARLAGEPLARLRFLLGAALGGLYAVAIFLPGLSFLARPPCRLAAAVLMVLAAFWKSRRLLRQVVIFFALSCAFGGGVLAIGLLGGEIRQVKDYRIPGTEVCHRLIFVGKVKKTPEKYPRQFAKIKKNPL